MSRFRIVLFVVLCIAFYGGISNNVDHIANAQDSSSNADLHIYLPIIANQDSNATVTLQPETMAETTDTVIAGALPSPTIGMWLTAAEIAQLPTSGQAWDWLKATADQATVTPTLSDQESLVNTRVLAKALVYARTGQTQYRTDVVEALRVITFNNTEAGGRTLALGRELMAYVVAADLIDLQGYDATLNTQFKNKLRELLTKPLDGLTLVSTHETRANNWGTHAGASRTAVALYLGDRAELERAALVLRGYLGDRSAYAGFDFGSDLSWQANPQAPVGVNPLGATKNGYAIDGALPDEMRRGGSFQWPPPYTNYAWGALQGTVVQAHLLQRAGYPVWQWQDRAILRAVQFLYGLGWAPSGDDRWQVWLINRAYGTSYPTEVKVSPGKNMGWTSWTHATTAVPSTNQPPSVNAGADLAITLPASANLAGAVTDDGLPNPPGATSVTWSVISGPGNVTFGNASATTTSASFAVAGVYTLQLTAKDSVLSSSDTVVITVNPAAPTNSPPSVNAGADAVLTLPASATLDGTVSDDGLPNNQLSVVWSMVSGPGVVTFGNATAVDTTATFSAAGVYTLQLTANDGALSSNDTVVVTVNPAAPTNNAPSVNAGADASITLPAGATLDGTVSDDGLPNNQVGVTWQMVSGPGTVTFGNVTAVDTTATFSVAGVYTLQLTANDSALSSSDTVVITVNPAMPTNRAPSVNAGADASITLPAGATLDGTVSDDGLPNNQLSVIWSMVSGPGAVTFGNATAVDTTASFSVAGIYTLQLTANDGALSSNDTVVITVNPAVSPVNKLQVRVSTKTDDAEERSGRKADLSDGDLELGEDSGAQIVGLRFRNLTLPKGAIITNAYLQFQTDEVTSGPINLLVQGEASDNAPVFVAAVNNLAPRPRTAATVGWAPVAWSKVGTAGVEQRTPNLASILQEIINRPGWQPGNSLVLLITGTGKRTAESYEGKAAAAPLLYIEYK